MQIHLSQTSLEKFIHLFGRTSFERLPIKPHTSVLERSKNGQQELILMFINIKGNFLPHLTNILVGTV